MDDRLRREVLGFVEGLAVREKDRLAALGTFAEIEDLTAEIGDEVARFELTRRAEKMIEAGVHACPECGRESPVEAELEPLILQGQRGEIEYSEPVCRCTRHLEWVAWEHGISSAPRQAFVADGASSIWAIHKKYFSQMTAIVDLMHALSYAYRAAAVLDEKGVYRRWARAIWRN